MRCPDAALGLGGDLRRAADQVDPQARVLGRGEHERDEVGAGDSGRQGAPRQLRQPDDGHAVGVAQAGALVGIAQRTGAVELHRVVDVHRHDEAASTAERQPDHL